MRRLLIATVLLLVAPLAVAQAYKWKDASGTVHYSDAPPPQGTKYSKVTTSGTVDAPASTPAPAASSSSGEGDQAAAQQGPMTDTPENRAKMCASLKSNMDILKGAGPVNWENNGKKEVMNQDQRKQQLDASQSQYQQYCSGS